MVRASLSARALDGAITLKDGRVKQGNFDTYLPMPIDEVKVIETHLSKSTEASGGIGETPTPMPGPAVAHAIFAVTGKRIGTLPIDTALLKSQVGRATSNFARRAFRRAASLGSTEGTP